MISCLGLLSCAQAAKSIGVKKCAPVYGNWCGENYPLAGYDPTPVDSWDQACRRHDKCYDSDQDRRSCDREFRREIERLSRGRIAPQAMANAHSWFTPDGVLVGFESLSTSVWALNASCKGGDGEKAEFFCQTNFGACYLSSTAGPGQPGSICHCNGIPGRIGER
jgi:hypothetical protein